MSRSCHDLFAGGRLILRQQVHRGHAHGDAHFHLFLNDRPVDVIGDGAVGLHAARVAAGMGAQLVIFGRHPEREATLQEDIKPTLRYLRPEPDVVAAQLRDADLVVGAVLIRGGRTPHVVSEAMVKGMQPGSVIVDVSIDQGGCVATSHPTTHSDPVFRKHEVTHYCVANMPGAYARTATQALASVTGDDLRLSDKELIKLMRYV